MLLDKEIRFTDVISEREEWRKDVESGLYVETVWLR